MIDTNNIKDFVDNIEINRLKKDYNDNKIIFEIVGNFIKKYKLILYGGYALNLILPEPQNLIINLTIFFTLVSELGLVPKFHAPENFLGF